MLIKGLKRPYYPKPKVVKKERWEYGNYEYPLLKHYEERVLFEKGRYRITEKTYEYLERMYGYRPSPEIAIIRRIQVKTLWWWSTLAEHSAKPPKMELIRASCFGERYDYEPQWENLGFGEKRLDELIRKDKE